MRWRDEINKAWEVSPSSWLDASHNRALSGKHPSLVGRWGILLGQPSRV